ncbi:hypothetical protein [Desulfonema magnum]|uniref:Uncharacterized protein n=1 Tax=Desulfonema magnum TaxID=45655 RepID=A0A975BQA3_9BACT|nr:hypothetical protein [Desulfonema magnum]QTA89507.1 Uncharacterized protein dnm_055630 [Desulfonema magnum]
MTRDEVLTREGWTKQVTYDEPRLSELVEMYEELDLEVHLEPFHPDEASGCVECMKASPEKFKTIYTKKRSQTVQ